jgi:Oxysterol-binding protein
MIYFEQISLTSTNFLIEDSSGLYRISGFFDFKIKFEASGNTLLIHPSGKAKISLYSGQEYTIEYPVMRIEGIISGKRTIRMEGVFKFNDEQNDLQAALSFSKGVSFFN